MSVECVHPDNSDVFSKSSTRERRLMVFSILTGILAITVLIVLAVILCRDTNHSNICMTPACVDAASKILQVMDESIDPCEDFYEFSCGKYRRNEIVSDDRAITTHSTAIENNIEMLMRKVLEEEAGEEIRAFQILKTIYKTCMNTSWIEKQGLGLAKNLIKHLGGWPVLEGAAWNQNKFEWTDVVLRLRTQGLSSDFFFTLDVEIDSKNSTNYILTIDQASLGLLRKFLIKGAKEKLVDAYFQFMVNMAVAFGANETLAREELQESLNFEIKLAEICTDWEDSQNLTLKYNPITNEQFKNAHPNIPWLKFINKYLSPVETVLANETINVKTPKFFERLEELLMQTPKRVLANYLVWRSVESIAGYLDENVQKITFAFKSQLMGYKQRQSRWKYCLSCASLSPSIGALYVRKYADPKIKDPVNEMVDYIQKAFGDIINGSEWMDEHTRKNALEKLKSMEKHVGFPSEMLDDKALDDYYKDLKITEGQFLMSMLNVSLFDKNEKIGRLREPVNKSDWVTLIAPIEVNARYSPPGNNIQIPTGILQGMFFNKDRPSYLNFGAIGSVLGHEITHGFDTHGSQLDKDGNLKNWWSPTVEEAFVQKSQCMIDQYGNYTVPELGMKLNGLLTITENIADNGGIKQAYLGYAKWLNKHGQEPLLPGLKYTQKQLFWITNAYVWCSNETPEYLKVTILTNVHPPHKYRVIGPLSNSEYFARDFNCRSGTKMNPVYKCTVW